jgi:hypothetical protein
MAVIADAEGGAAGDERLLGVVADLAADDAKENFFEGAKRSVLLLAREAGSSQAERGVFCSSRRRERTPRGRSSSTAMCSPSRANAAREVSRPGAINDTRFSVRG